VVDDKDAAAASGDTSTTEVDSDAFDMEAGVAEIATGLGLGIERDDDPSHEVDDESEPDTDTDTKVTPAVQATIKPDGTDQAATVVKAAPNSWPKETHELWGKLSPEAQTQIEHREKQMSDGLNQYKEHYGFGKQMRDVLTPYKAIIDAQGINEPQAVQFLMNAHYRLTQGSPEQRQAAYMQLGKNLGLVEGVADAEIDPNVRNLQERQDRIESALTARQQAEYNEALQRTEAEVTAFASDEKHPYFDEVADDITAFIGKGHKLEDAYEKAVWANPVTRQKELARIQTETDAKRKEKAKQEVLTARRATATNISGRETRKAPTEPKGTWDDTMRDTLKEIKERAH
jgi:hypothetical protein